MILTWLTATSIGCVAFLLFVLAGYAVSESRRLRKAGATRPAVIVWKRVAGPVLRIASPRADVTPAPDLVGASLWLEWDQRWGAQGACMGRVVRHMNNDDRARLLIETAAPQALPAGPTSTVWFTPAARRELLTHHVAVVRGTLRGASQSDDVAAEGGPLTAEIAVISR